MMRRRLDRTAGKMPQPRPPLLRKGLAQTQAAVPGSVVADEGPIYAAILHGNEPLIAAKTLSNVAAP
jgi:hypothetical protein